MAILRDNRIMNTTFDNYNLSDENREAYESLKVQTNIMRRILEPKSELIYLFGDSMAGKSHLLGAINNELTPIDGCIVNYITAYNFRLNLEFDSSQLEREAYIEDICSSDVLLVDDIDDLEGYDSIIKKLFEIAEKLLSKGKMVVFTGCKSPSDIDFNAVGKKMLTSGIVLELNKNEKHNYKQEMKLHRQKGINPQFTFETFKFNNDLVNKKIGQLSDSGKILGDFVYFYGKGSCGKSILLQCLGNQFIDENRTNLLYQNAENYLNSVISAIRDNSGLKFEEHRNKFRNLDVLLFDDLQFLWGKVNTVKEFTHMINDLRILGSTIIMTGDRPLEELDFPDRMMKKLMMAEQIEMTEVFEKNNQSIIS